MWIRYRIPLFGISALLALAIPSLLLTSPASAQSSSFAAHPFTIEVNGGVATFSRFLEQRIDGGERELTAETSPTVSVAVGYQPWEKAAIRISGSFVPAKLEYKTDVGNGSTALDASDLGKINVVTLGVEVVRFVSLPVGPFRPYGSAGVLGSMWTMDTESLTPGEVAPQGDGLLRLGAITRAGLQISATPQLSLRLEINSLTTGSPFDGKDSFRLVDGETVFDESEVASIRQLMLGLAFAF